MHGFCRHRWVAEIIQCLLSLAENFESIVIYLREHQNKLTEVHLLILSFSNFNFIRSNLSQFSVVSQMASSVTSILLVMKEYTVNYMVAMCPDVVAKQAVNIRPQTLLHN